MAINPYMTPAEQPMVDTYVPIPFQEMAQAGAMTQARYEDAMAREEALGLELANLQGLSSVALPGLAGANIPVEQQRISLPDAQVVASAREEYMAL